jgi:hypothetical protein
MSGTECKKKLLKACDTCPWIRANQQNPPKGQPAEWYTTKNIKRLWDGLRTGIAPGVLCHSLDPNSDDYGGKGATNGHKEHCAGAVQAMIEEMNQINNFPSLREYTKRRVKPVTRAGLGVWVERQLFGQMPDVQRHDDIGLPWDQDKQPK